MQIRNKLTYQFVGIVASVLLLATLTIFVLFAEFRERDFYIRLNEKAIATAKLLVDENDVDAALLKLIDKNLRGVLPQEKVIIFDSSGKEIYNTDDEKKIKVSKELITSIRLQKEVHLKQNDFEMLGLSYNYNNNNYIIVAAAIDIYGLRKLKFLSIVLLVVFLISIAAVYFSGWIYSGRALEPISKVVREVDSISVNNLNARVGEGNGQDEIALLAKTFNKMLERIEAAFNAQRAFVGNASHELRNPLSVIRGQLEVALMKPRDKKEYIETLESLLEDIKHLTIISNRLLSLAQVSGVGLIDPKNEIRIDELLLETREELLQSTPEYNINISFETSIENDDSLLFQGNERLLKIAFFNLMENGCKYSPDHSCLVDIGAEKENIVIRFSDKGVGIPADDLKNIFEPFYRGKNVIDRKGHGIGLSLVDKIVRLHGGSIAVDSTVKKGSVFTVKLPVT
ncbi:MAG: Adaptive-response sensory-kinase SasA [Bacteroidia bacterium]|nr:Adaptive-response sensory-kinase SasA [Bacteroidia bacterium]